MVYKDMYVFITMEELLYIVQRVHHETNEEVAILHEKTSVVVKELLFAARQREKIAAKALLLLAENKRSEKEKIAAQGLLLLNTNN